MAAIPVYPDSTIGETFFRAAETWDKHAFLAVPANAARAYDPDGAEWTYAQVARAVRALMRTYAAAGYGLGHRVGLMLDNRPQYFMHQLALNALGVCVLPLNPDYRARETAYVIDHARVDLIVALAGRVAQIGEAIAEATQRPPLTVLEDFDATLAVAPRPADAGLINAATPACVLYTSGTTGRPKGCVLSHGYVLAAGVWYGSRGHMLAFGLGTDRLYNPLPVFHVNAGVFSFYCVMLRGNCQIQTDRFAPQRWWPEVVQTRATVVHYLGVIAPLLLGQPESALEHAHQVRFGAGAGVEPQLHARFEARFGFPLIELWGMTEMVRGLFDNEPGREVGTRSFGHAMPGVEVRVVDELDQDVPDGQPGEMVMRHSAATPRKDFFSGYLDDDAATESAWRGGWFHTGDIVWRGPGGPEQGRLHFVDRRKNIIRRSGENIAAAEVEALLQSHPDVQQVAVLAAPDEIREEEVLACVVLHEHAHADAATARALFDWCDAALAYYKAPGWIWFTAQLPTTGTQKIQKHQIFPAGADPRGLPGMFDLRALKRRTSTMAKET